MLDEDRIAYCQEVENFAMAETFYFFTTVNYVRAPE